MVEQNCSFGRMRPENINTVQATEGGALRNICGVINCANAWVALSSPPHRTISCGYVSIVIAWHANSPPLSLTAESVFLTFICDSPSHLTFAGEI